jgi:hypothetical protein
MFISPQNFPVVGLVDSSKSKCTDESPPMSASHPVANCSTSDRELKEKSVFGSREGGSAPCIRSTRFEENISLDIYDR